MLRVHVDAPANAELESTLDELVAEGARRMLAAAMEAEVDAYVSSFTDEVDEEGKRLVVRNDERAGTCGIFRAHAAHIDAAGEAPGQRKETIVVDQSSSSRVRKSFSVDWAL